MKYEFVSETEWIPDSFLNYFSYANQTETYRLMVLLLVIIII